MNLWNNPQVYEPKADVNGLKDFQDQPLRDFGQPVKAFGTDATAGGVTSREDAMRGVENIQQAMDTGNGYGTMEIGEPSVSTVHGPGAGSALASGTTSPLPDSISQQGTSPASANNDVSTPTAPTTPTTPSPTSGSSDPDSFKPLSHLRQSWRGSGDEEQPLAWRQWLDTTHPNVSFDFGIDEDSQARIEQEYADYRTRGSDHASPHDHDWDDPGSSPWFTDPIAPQRMTDADPRDIGEGVHVMSRRRRGALQWRGDKYNPGEYLGRSSDDVDGNGPYAEIIDEYGDDGPEKVRLDVYRDEGDGGQTSYHPDMNSAKAHAEQAITGLGGQLSMFGSRRKQAWSGWGPAQFPKKHKVAGWDWDEHLNGFITTSHRKFACDCGEEHDVPSYQQCKCGKIWNSYVIGTGPDTRTASPEKFIAREIPVRDGVIVASRRPRTARFQDDFAEHIQDTVPDTDQEARYVNYLQRWKNMTRNEGGGYRPQEGLVEGWQDYWPAPEGTWDGTIKTKAPAPRAAAFTPGHWGPDDLWVEHSYDQTPEQFGPGETADDYVTTHPKFRKKPKAPSGIAAARTVLAESNSADYEVAGFEDWLMAQGDSIEALKQSHAHELESKLREYLGERGDAGLVDEILQRVGRRTGASFLDDQRETQRSRRHLDPDEYKAAAFDWKRPPQGNGITVEVTHGPGWWASVHPNGSWMISRPDASPLAHGRAGGPVEAKGLVEQHLTRAKAPLASRTATVPTITAPWSGKTPGGPQGPGVEGLKQKTRYKGYSTPALRGLHRRMLTTQNPRVDMNELLRELSFREVLGRIHDPLAAGGTPPEEGKKTRRTDPTMTATEDWNRRDRGGRWTRGDGHTMTSGRTA